MSISKNRKSKKYTDKNRSFPKTETIEMKSNKQPIELDVGAIVMSELKEKSALSGKKWDAAMKGLAKNNLVKVHVEGELKTVELKN